MKIINEIKNKIIDFLRLVFIREMETKDKKGFRKKIDWKVVVVMGLFITIETLIVILIFK